MKVLVTGVRGQLGHDVEIELKRRGHAVTGVDAEEMDITDPARVKEVFEEVRPSAVVHCAAWTRVDDAEENEERVRLVNAVGTENVASACGELGCKLMYLSTDYVFGGRGEVPFLPDCREFQPLNVYGQTKLEGEFAVEKRTKKYFIVRIAWVFGNSGNNFVRTMLRLGRTHDVLRVVCDQIGTPTYTRDLSRLLADMLETEKYGRYHATNEGGYISWYEFAVEIFRQAGYGTKVLPVTTEEYGLSKARRPLNSRLDKSKLIECGFEPLPDWRDALKRYLKEIGDGTDQT